LISALFVGYAFKTMIYDQAGYDIVCEWGAEGVSILAPTCDVVIVIDVLSFTTAVDIATSQGATIFPYRWKDETTYEFAVTVNAEVADRDNSNSFNLSPSSLQNLPENTRLVLPSPNGSTVSLLAGNTTVIAGCLRNCRAVAESAMQKGKRIAVIPAGERWSNDTLRPSVEDFIGAGAIISYLPRDTISPEAAIAKSVFENFSVNLHETIKNCVSGKEVIARGEERDVFLATELNASDCVPLLKNGAFEKES
jgi:2-phosphosulfolactate phosphatase